MRNTKYSVLKSNTTWIAAIAAIGLVGCADLNESDVEESQTSALTQPSWKFCAYQGQRCTFSGTRQVRFVSNGRSVAKTFTGGVDCRSTLFGAVSSPSATCDVDMSVAAPATDAGSAVQDAGSAVQDAGHQHPVADAAAGDAMVMAMGPYINNAAIPKGNPGVSTVEVRATTEQPVSSDVGQFRTSCSYSHMNYDDPIVFPGQPGKAHLHTYFGNTGANANSTAESLRNSGNSTCRGGIANRSAYWVPAVIAKDGTPLKPQSASVYYKTGYEGVKPSQVKVFPQGLRMIAGDAKSQIQQAHGYWGCETYIGHPGNIPDCPAGEAVIMTVQFPQCWNGKDLDSADHKSHMSYPINGGCPSTHPYAMPEISFNIRYFVPPGTRSSDWRLSSDMYPTSKPGGFSAHGDWFEGWDRQIAETFVKNCDTASVDCHSHLLGDGRMIFNSLEPQD